MFEIIPSESIASIQSLADLILKLDHKDYMDCLIFGTAKFYSYTIVSMDSELVKKLAQSEFWKDLKIIDWKTFLKEINL